MGPVGWPEMVMIFFVALLLFGPKKLPELGKNLAKGLAEFKRAQNELKSTFEREMRSLERENESLKDVTNSYHDTYNYDYSAHYDSGSYGTEANDSTANTAVTTASASAPQGAELTSGTQPEGTIANGSMSAANGKTAEPSGSEKPEAETAPTTERQILT